MYKITIPSLRILPVKTNGGSARATAEQSGPELSGLSHARLLFYARLAGQSQETAQPPAYSLNDTHSYERLSVKLFATELQTKLQKNTDLSSTLEDLPNLDVQSNSNFASTLKKTYRTRNTSFKVKRLKFKQMVKAKNSLK